MAGPTWCHHGLSPDVLSSVRPLKDAGYPIPLMYIFFCLKKVRSFALQRCREQIHCFAQEVGRSDTCYIFMHRRRGLWLLKLVIWRCSICQSSEMARIMPLWNSIRANWLGWIQVSAYCYQLWPRSCHELVSNLFPRKMFVHPAAFL